MKLPAKIEYGCRAVLELALRYESHAPVQLSTISEFQNIPKKFLVQILIRLKNGKIVDSSRGIAGGYFLIRAPSRISLADVFTAIDSNLISNAESGGERSNGSLVGRIWSEINIEVFRRLNEITLEDLITKIKSGQLTYNI